MGSDLRFKFRTTHLWKVGAKVRGKVRALFSHTLFGVLFLCLPYGSFAAGFKVTSSFDGIVGEVAGCTFREVIENIHNGTTTDYGCDLTNPFPSSFHTITFDSTVTINTVNLVEFLVIDGLTFNIPEIRINPGGSTVTFSGDDSFSLITIQRANVSMENVHFEEGYNGDPASFVGGAMSVIGESVVNMTDCTFDGNHSDSDGGAMKILGGSTVNITDCTFNLNTATFAGGAIFLSGEQENPSSLNIDGSTFSGNIAGNPMLAPPRASQGGAIYVDAYHGVNISNSTYWGNSVTNGAVTCCYQDAAEGGAIYASFTDTVLNINHSTFTENSVFGREPSGGAISSLSTVSLVNSVVANNFSDSPGGIFPVERDLYLNYSSSVTARGNVIGDSSKNVVQSLGSIAIPGEFFVNNFVATSDQQNVAAGSIYNALANNGGLTLTHALPANSPAIDGGHGDSCIALDQRNETRDTSLLLPLVAPSGTAIIPLGAVCDSGAYEDP